jgi:1-acyl-sn-glycerol-3-phosphate acyltransferase
VDKLGSTLRAIADPQHNGMALDQRDPGYIRAWMTSAEWFSRYYFRVRVSGLDTVPTSGPVIFVGNHSGGLSTPDAAMAAHALWSRFGLDRPAFAMITPHVFASKSIGKHLMKVGGVAATSRMARKVLDAGASMLIYPGGGDEAYRSFWDRNVVDLRNQSAYIRLAIKYRVPIVPIVCRGGHNTLFVLSDGERITRALKLDTLGITRLPVVLGWPAGVTMGIHHTVPFPARMDLEFGPPINLDGFTPAMARDREVVAACHSHVERRMQATLDRMVQARIHERMRPASEQ